jgi:ribosome recycling factor
MAHELAIAYLKEIRDLFKKESGDNSLSTIAIFENMTKQVEESIQLLEDDRVARLPDAIKDKKKETN